MNGKRESHILSSRRTGWLEIVAFEEGVEEESTCALTAL